MFVGRGECVTTPSFVTLIIWGSDGNSGHQTLKRQGTSKVALPFPYVSSCNLPPSHINKLTLEQLFIKIQKGDNQ